MQVSYSRIETFKQCPFKYKLRYLDQLDVFDDDSATNALFQGSAMHVAIQESIDKGIETLYSNYPVVTDEVISESLKLELIARKARKLVPPNGIIEYEINCDEYKGFIDYLVKKENGHYDLYDFKYCNGKNASKYLDSAQLHLYKYYFEKLSGEVIDNLYFVIIPKTAIRLKKDESLDLYRLRIRETCEQIEPYLMPIEYDENKVKEFFNDVQTLEVCTEFPTNETRLCDWCEYCKYCKLGDTTMLLPTNARRNIATVTKRKIWIYGAPFTGKTQFANKFNDVLMLNTDGNINFVDAPFIALKDVVTVEGRLTKRTFAWQIFKDAVSELEKKQNDFKTIVVDLLEDTYEHCRLYMYDQLHITHESDDSFRAWDKVRTEFLSVIKRLMNLDYENIILISHEDTSRDLTKRSGDKTTAIKPNINDKMANKIAGMVDIVARIVCNDDERVLSFKNNETIFGGGRVKVNKNEIPLNISDFNAIYNDSLVKAEPTPAPVVEEQPTETVVETEPVVEQPTETAPVERKRRRRTATTAE